jgi:hypothetical protein
MRRWMPGVLALMALGSATASAQTVTIVECRPRVGLTLGAATNSNDIGIYGAYPNDGSNRALDVSGTAELPIVDRWSVRGDVGSAEWAYQLRDVRGEPLLRDRVRVTRVTIAAVKQSPTPCGGPLRLYGGFGYGAYRYDFTDQRAASWRGGGHLVGGIEVTPREHVAVAADLFLHAIGGPRRSPVNASGLLVLQINFGVRFVF